MHRTEGSGHSSNLFVNTQTIVEENWLNAVQEEICNTIEEAGITLKIASTDTRDQLKDAVIKTGNQYFIAKDVKASGTHGGDFNSGAYRVRDLNYYETNIVGASVSANFTDSNMDNNGATPDATEQQFTLPAGTYLINACARTYVINNEKIILYNVTDAATELIGIPWCSPGTSGCSCLIGSFTISSQKTFDLRHRSSNTQLVNGFGLASGFGDEIYATLIIIKIGM